jgi:hypothetical protein
MIIMGRIEWKTTCSNTASISLFLIIPHCENDLVLAINGVRGFRTVDNEI